MTCNVFGVMLNLALSVLSWRLCVYAADISIFVKIMPSNIKISIIN